MMAHDYSPETIENKWREKWNEWGIHKWDPFSTDRPTFIIDTPPPTVSGTLHIGHVFSYTHQDLIARFKRMRGMNVCYPMGWDDNGLPTERRVQNYFKVRCNPNLAYQSGLLISQEENRQQEVSRPNFIELCHAVTSEDEKAFKDLFTKLG